MLPRNLLHNKEYDAASIRGQSGARGEPGLPDEPGVPEGQPDPRRVPAARRVARSPEGRRAQLREGQRGGRRRHGKHAPLGLVVCSACMSKCFRGPLPPR